MGPKNLRLLVYGKAGLIAAFVFCWSFLGAQVVTKKDLLCFSGGALCGAAWGTHELISHRYDAFKALYPKARDQYWNPAISHTNKHWRNVPAHISDAKHVLASSTQIGLFAVGVVIGRKCTWKSVLRNAAWTTAGYVVGNYVAYDMPIKRKDRR